MDLLPADVLVCIFKILSHNRHEQGLECVTHPVIAAYQTCRRFRSIVIHNGLAKNPNVHLAQLEYGSLNYLHWYIRCYVELLTVIKPHKFILTRIRELGTDYTYRPLSRLWKAAQGSLPVLAISVPQRRAHTQLPKDPSEEEKGEGDPSLFWPDEDQEASRCNGLKIRKASEQRYEECYKAFYERVSGKDSLKLKKPGDIYLAISECQSRFHALIERIVRVTKTDKNYQIR